MAQWRWAVAVVASVSAPACGRQAATDSRLTDWPNTVDMVPYNMVMADMADSKCPADADRTACSRMADMVHSASDADSEPMVRARPMPVAERVAAATAVPADSGMCVVSAVIRRRLFPNRKRKR